MGPELLDIQPRELKFTFELKKQSTCSVKLVNNSYQYVAFKVKTTSPKKYCVRPNIGVVPPMSTCDFTVTMQAQRVAPPDMQCKDKFLIQSTVVPYGTTEEGITSSMFAKDNGMYIEESKLKVVLVEPPHFTILLPPNGTLKKESEAPSVKNQVLNGVDSPHSPHKVYKDTDELKPTKDVEILKPLKDVVLEPTKNEELKPVEDVDELYQAKGSELKEAKDLDFKVAKDLEPTMDAEEFKQAKDVTLKLPEELKAVKDVEELKPAKNVDPMVAKNVEELRLAKDLADFKSAKHAEDLKLTKDVESEVVKDVELNIAKDVEELKSKLMVLESKLSEAEVTITKLREERSTSIEERQTLQQQMALLRRKNGGFRRGQKGFPFLFVCMVTLVGIALGYLLRSRGSQSF